jgi:hypothetical protein
MTAHAVVALVGQHAQDLGLGRLRHVGDLVEEQCAAMRLLEEPRTAGVFAVDAEQLLLDPFGSHHSRGNDDERPVRARAPLVDGARRDFLAHACRAGDEDPAAGRRDPLQSRPDAIDRDRASAEHLAVNDVLAKALVLAAQPLGFGRARDEVQQVPGLERLFDEVHRPFSDCRDRGIEIAVAGDHQHRQAGVVALDLLEELDAVEARSLEPDVEEYQGWPPVLDRFQRRVTVAGGSDRITLVLEHSADEVANIFLVVDHQHLKRHWHRS